MTTTNEQMPKTEEQIILDEWAKEDLSPEGQAAHAELQAWHSANIAEAQAQKVAEAQAKKVGLGLTQVGSGFALPAEAKDILERGR